MRTSLTVIGLGYVGLPLALEAVRAGMIVEGYDPNAALVGDLTDGHSHVDDISDEDLAIMRHPAFNATAVDDDLRFSDVIVICVPTPLSQGGGPDLSAVRSAAQTAANMLIPGTLVVLESTSYPGTTDEVVRPILEADGLVAGVDFHLAFSPERIDPGNKVYGLRNTPKIVGGHTAGCTVAAASFYGKLCDTVIVAKGTREAEMAKLLENTYRHVNIALVNEMAIFCHEMGIDLEDAIRCAATKPFGFHAFHPGPGVGGHCIPIDPNYLSHKVITATGRPFRFVELAQDINKGMPDYVVSRAADMLNGACKSLNGSTVLILGVTYKADIADQRETPATDVVRKLRKKGARVIYHDPYVGTFQVDGLAVEQGINSLDDSLAKSDLTILLQGHRVYGERDIASGTDLLLDTTGSATTGQNVEGL